MFRKIVVGSIVGFATLVGLADASHAAVTPGSVSVDPRTGVITWTDVITCTPGDDVELDITVTQRGEVAFLEVYRECTAGQMAVSGQSFPEEGSALLRPGQAVVNVDRTDYSPASEVDVVRSATGAAVVIRPG